MKELSYALASIHAPRVCLALERVVRSKVVNTQVGRRSW